MRTSMAYFAGAGTVIAAIGLGLGGGLTIANVLSPHQEKLEQTKLEQRMSAKAIPPSPQADQPKQQAEQTKAPVPYVAATNAAISANPPPAQTESQPQPQTQAAAPAPQASPSPAPQQASIAKDQIAKISRRSPSNRRPRSRNPRRVSRLPHRPTRPMPGRDRLKTPTPTHAIPI